MRQKTRKLLITFPTTASAIATEQYCQRHNLPGRLIPVPGSVSAGCGMAWCCAIEQRELLCAALREAGIEPSGFYERMV